MRDRDHIEDILARCSEALGEPLDRETLRPPEPEGAASYVADAGTTLYVEGTVSRRGFCLSLSNPLFPHAADCAARQAERARALVGDRLGGAVCTAILTERHGIQSFALYPQLGGYSQNRGVRWIQKRSVSRSAITWLTDAFAATASEVEDDDARDAAFLRPLRRLAEERGPDETVSRSALALEGAMRRGEIRAFSGLQHGDFWLGNVLPTGRPTIRRSGPDWGFAIIDWRGARVAGHPAIDALRFSMSGFGQGRAAASRLRRYGAKTGLTDRECAASCLCAMGWLADNLDQFPRPRFHAGATKAAQFLVRNEFV